MAGSLVSLTVANSASLVQKQAISSPKPKSNARTVQASASNTSSDAVSVEVAAKRNATSAVSDAASRVNIADDAVSQISELVSKAHKLAKDFEDGSFKGEQRAAKAEEAETILAEIDNIVSTASFNGQNVFNNGDTSVSVNLSAADGSSADTVSVTIPGVKVSTSDLGLSGLNGNDFINDSKNTRLALEDASLRLNSAGNTLTDNSSKLENFTNTAGLTAGTQADAAANPPAASPEDLASRVASAASSITSTVGNLDSSRVDALLAEDAATKKEAGSATTAATTSKTATTTATDPSAPSAEELQKLKAKKDQEAAATTIA